MFSLLKAAYRGAVRLSKLALFSFMMIGFGTAFVITAPRMFENAFFMHNGVDIMYVAAVELDGRVGHGTGFHVTSSKGKQFLITAQHVCKDPNTKVNMVIYDVYGNEYPTSIVKMSKDRDLCALMAVGKFNSFVLQEDLPDLSSLYQIGYPKDYPLMINSGEVVGIVNGVFERLSTEEDCVGGTYNRTVMEITIGVITNTTDLSTCEYQYKLLQTTVSVRPGFSGSPIMNIRGQAVGMTVQGDPGNWGRAITASDIETFIEGIE